MSSSVRICEASSTRVNGSWFGADAHDLSRPPVFWTEAWSRYTRQWITVDPVRKKYRCKSIMEPARSTVENQLLYVVALEEGAPSMELVSRDGY